MEIFTRSFLTRVAWLAATVLVYLMVVASVFHKLEQWTWPQAFYFSAVTITTVGYGDLHPTTDLSRMVATVFVLISIPIFFLALGIVGESVFARYHEGTHRTHHEVSPPKKRRRARRS